MRLVLFKSKAGLTAKKVTVTRGGKTFQQTVYVKTGNKEKQTMVDIPLSRTAPNKDVRSQIGSKRAISAIDDNIDNDPKLKLRLYNSFKEFDKEVGAGGLSFANFARIQYAMEEGIIE